MLFKKSRKIKRVFKADRYRHRVYGQVGGGEKGYGTAYPEVGYVFFGRLIKVLFKKSEKGRAVDIINLRYVGNRKLRHGSVIVYIVKYCFKKIVFLKGGRL